MRSKSVDIEHARTHLARLIARVERGERIVIARAGKPVAELRLVRKTAKRSAPLDEALLRVKEYGYDGPVGPTSNRDIDRVVYGV